MKNWPLSLVVDGSNETGLEKMLPITVRIFHVNFGRVMTQFFDMNLLSGRDSGTAEVIFYSIDAQFTKNMVYHGKMRVVWALIIQMRTSEIVILLKQEFYGRMLIW